MGEIAYIDEVAVTPLNEFVPPTVGKPMVSMVASDGDAGEPANNGSFTVSRTGSTSGSLRVYYRTSGSTATGGNDYARLMGYVDIPSGQDSALIGVIVIDDSSVEDPETVKVTLSSNAAYDIDPSNGFATVTIADNDQWTFAITMDAQDEAKMGEHYRVNLGISAPDSWPGGDISVVVTEANEPVHATWNIHDNEYYDTWGWPWQWGWKRRPEAVCPLQVYEDGVLTYKANDYTFGTSIPVHLDPGATAYCYLQPFHRWYWMPPWSPKRLLDSLLMFELSQLLKYATDIGGIPLGAIKQIADAMNGQHKITYTYTAIYGQIKETDSTDVKVPTPKYVILGTSIFASAVGSFETGCALPALVAPDPTGLTKAGALALLVQEAAYIATAQGLYVLANDPPDFNYTEVTVPEVPDIPELSQIDDPNYLEAAEKVLELAAISTALRTSMERYEAAKIAGLPEYMNLQLEAAKTYTGKIVELSDWLSDFWGPIGESMPVPTAQQIQQARDSLLQDGLPNVEVAVLSAFGYSAEQIEEIGQTVAGLPDEYFTSAEKIGEGFDTVGSGAAEFRRYISGPNSVDEFVHVSVEHVGYDRQTRRFGVDIRVTNVSTTTIWTPVWLVIESTSAPLVVLATSDGRTTEDKDYADLSDLLLDDGKLDPLESVTKRIYFYNPEAVRFTFEPSVRGVIVEEPAPGPLEQLSGLSRHWLEGEPSLDMAPVGGDGIVNFRDFALMAEEWLNKEE
jgi:hypothetical protein